MGESQNVMVLPPTPEILAICDVLDNTITRFLAARDTIPSWGEFEAQDESHIIMLYIIRNIQGINLLARDDLALLPGARIMGRAIFEHAVKGLWMMLPEDPYEREARWLAYCTSSIQYYEKMEKEFNKTKPELADQFKQQSRAVAGIYEYIADRLHAKFPGKYRVKKGLPDMKSLLSELGWENRYFAYIMASQDTHGTQVATGIYRKGWGNDKEFGEFISPANWHMVFLYCWTALFDFGTHFLVRSGANIDNYLSQTEAVSRRKTIDKILMSEE